MKIKRGLCRTGLNEGILWPERVTAMIIGIAVTCMNEQLCGTGGILKLLFKKSFI